MEGRPTSVTETVTLPAQPTTGSTTFVPLGGDGFIAPKFAYAVRNFLLTGDATGTFVQQTIEMDERWCALVAFVEFTIQQATSADAEFQLSVSSDKSAELIDSGLQVAVNSSVSSLEVGHLWNPPPLVLPGAGDNARIRLQTLNVDGDIVRLSAYIYLFDVRVRETTPMGPLLWARGST